jgi:hypothetical protein
VTFFINYFANDTKFDWNNKKNKKKINQNFDNISVLFNDVVI